jgi:hypothetical protein
MCGNTAGGGVGAADAGAGLDVASESATHLGGVFLDRSISTADLAAIVA